MRNAFYKLPVLGLVVLAAACGGGNDAAQSEPAAPAGGTVSTDVPDAAAPAAVTTNAPNTTATTAPATGTVHEVKMVTTNNGASGEFQPANITVKKGDVIRFVSEGVAVHNVSFPADQNAGKSNLPAPGPFESNGGTYELQVNMDAGTYNYQCDPHAAMGMKGVLTVQ